MKEWKTITQANCRQKGKKAGTVLLTSGQITFNYRMYLESIQRQELKQRKKQKYYKRFQKFKAPQVVTMKPCTVKLENLDKTKRFLESCKFPKMNEEKIKNLNRTITSKR